MSDAFIVQRKHLHSQVQEALDNYTALLSLDGGGLRGVISAQVLIELEDAIKQALWKEGLIKPEVVKQILASPRAKRLVPAASQHLLEEAAAAPALDGLFQQRKAERLALEDAKHKGPGAYAKKQAELLQPPKDWEVYKLCFDVDLVDWFDQLAGTSTGGLLALYLASKGGDPKKLKEMEEKEAKGRKPQGVPALKPRPGSGAGASEFYLNNAKTIFGTGLLVKGKNMVASGGQYQHSAAGLDTVLKGVFGDLTLKDLQANVAITTVDVAAARTAFFFKYFIKEGESLPGRKPEELQGFATSLRKGDGSGVLVRAAPMNLEDFAGKLNPLSTEGLPITPMINLGDPVPHSDAARAGGANGPRGSAPPAASAVPESRTALLSSDALADADLQNGGGQASAALVPAALRPGGAINMFGINVITARGGWVAPVQFEHRDFYVVDVARSTSAAPAFLPPKVLGPVGFKDAKPPLPAWGKTGRTFLDGGLGNNDPVWMGLAMMLQRYNTVGLDKAAILSLGTGTTTTCTAYNPGNAGFLGNVLGFFGQALTLGLARVSGLLGALISLTMSLNGEDKEHILRLIYYGLLRLPPGQYLRIQLKDEAREYVDPKTGKELPDGEIKIRKDALGKMDDPDDKIMQAYVRMGKDVASRFSLRLAWWVRCYVFCIDNPNKMLFLAERDGKGTRFEARPGAAPASLPA